MKNLTITLPEDVAALARVEAARDGKSVARWLCDLIADRRREGSDERLSALREWLQGPGWPSDGGSLPTREELHAEREDELLRRYEHSR